MYLGIDIGTSGVKVVLTDNGSNIIGSETSDLKVVRENIGWSEQEPNDWWKATNEAIFKIKDKYFKELKNVQGIGLSGQMHGLTALDEKYPLFRNVCGNVVMPGFTAPKALWLKNNELQVFKKIHSILLPKDYVRLLMTGEKCSDMSDSSGSLWLDIKKRNWSIEALKATDLSIKQMPNIVEGSEISGKLKKSIADDWGIDGRQLLQVEVVTTRQQLVV